MKRIKNIFLKTPTFYLRLFTFLVLFLVIFVFKVDHALADGGNIQFDSVSKSWNGQSFAPGSWFSPGYSFSENCSDCISPHNVNAIIYWGDGSWDFLYAEGTGFFTPPKHYYYTPGTFSMRLRLTWDCDFRNPLWCGGQATLNAWSNDPSWVTITIPAPPALPTADIKANGSDGPITIDYNTAATISWTSANASSCRVNYPPLWTGTSGVQSSGNLILPQTYTLSCCNSVSCANNSVIVNVGPAPTADIKAKGPNDANPSDGPIIIDYNTAATISWTSTNVTSCSVSPKGWSGISGSQPGDKLISSQTYSISCSGPGGLVADSVIVNVRLPLTADIKAKGPNDANPSDGPISINSGDSADITWISTNSSSCSVSPNGWSGTSGNQPSGPLTSAVTYMLMCIGNYSPLNFIDSSNSPKTIAPNGNVIIDTSQSEFGDSSAVFDGSGDYLSVPDSNDWSFGKGNFTIDFWVRFNSVAKSASLFGQSTDDGGYLSFDWYQPTNTLYFTAGSAYLYQIYLGTPFSPSMNTWYHIALVRKGSTASDWLIFVNGTSQIVTLGTGGYSPILINYRNPLTIGYSPYAQSYLNGWIDEFRVSKGIARWTGNFTPPTAEYSSDSNTNLLLHMDTDGGIATDSVTVNINPIKHLGILQGLFSGNQIILPNVNDSNRNMIIKYDSNIVDNPPPGFSDLIAPNWGERVP